MRSLILKQRVQEHLKYDQQVLVYDEHVHMMVKPGTMQCILVDKAYKAK